MHLMFIPQVLQTKMRKKIDKAYQSFFLHKKLDFYAKKGYNKVMKRFFAKMFAFVMVLSICFAGGCLGIGDGLDFFDDLFSKFENGEISEEEYYDKLADMESSIYGTKILYRPESYDYDGNSGGTEEQPNDYYGRYSWQIMRRLEAIYGVATNITLVNGYYQFDDSTLPYLYDSIRYQVDRQYNISNAVTIDQAGNVSTPTSQTAVALSANLGNAWNWSFAIDLDDANQKPALYNDYNTSDKTINYVEFTENGATKVINVLDSFSYPSFDSAKEYFIDHYGNISTTYLNTYVGTEGQYNYDLYSDFVKALEYAIYRYAIDLEPGQVVVEIPEDPIPEDGTYYSVSVTETINGVQVSYTIDEALANAQANFERLGGYVGISARNRTKIANWILNNVIGEKAMSSDIVTVYDGATLVTYTDANGTTTTFAVSSQEELENIMSSLEYEGELQYEGETITEATPDTVEVKRDYQNTVFNMVEKVCEEVSIGNDGEEGGNVTVDDRYLASEIKEYWGESFVAGGDEDPFPYYEDFSAHSGTPVIMPLEYQSVVLMFKETVNVTAVTITLQYDADLDGYQTASGQPFDENRFLTIEIMLNFYDHETNTLTQVGSKMVNVPDGKMKDAWGDDDLEDAEKRYSQQHGSSISFSQLVSFGVDESILGAPSKDLIVGPFNTQIGNGILMTDVGRNDYRGNPLVSKTPIQLTGLSKVKDYYSIIEPTEEQIANGETYLTGQLNHEMFAGNDGCDYLEVVYRVVKRVGDTETNYKFYTAVDAVTDRVLA